MSDEGKISHYNVEIKGYKVDVANLMVIAAAYSVFENDNISTMLAMKKIVCNDEMYGIVSPEILDIIEDDKSEQDEMRSCALLVALDDLVDAPRPEGHLENMATIDTYERIYNVLSRNTVSGSEHIPYFMTLSFYIRNGKIISSENVSNTIFEMLNPPELVTFNVLPCIDANGDIDYCHYIIGKLISTRIVTNKDFERSLKHDLQSEIPNQEDERLACFVNKMFHEKCGKEYVFKMLIPVKPANPKQK